MKKSTPLRQAYEAQGFTKALEAWRHHKKLFAGKVGSDLFTSNANGNREVSKNAALLYAAAFGHDPAFYLYKETTGDQQLSAAQLRSALLAYGIHRDDLPAAMRAISGFLTPVAEQPQPDQPRGQSEPASRRRAKEPS